MRSAASWPSESRLSNEPRNDPGFTPDGQASAGAERELRPAQPHTSATRGRPGDRALAREKPSAGAVRTTSLANRRQTLAVLGFLRPEASAFERLALAGRMMKEA